VSVVRVGAFAAICLAALGAAVSAARGSLRATPVRHEVQMRAISFTPAELVVAIGDTVEWRNADIVRHNAVRVDLFETGDLKPGERGSWVPSDTGTFTYRCTIHARMRGKIVVR
jgi:plastocyanin